MQSFNPRHLRHAVASAVSLTLAVAPVVAEGQGKSNDKGRSTTSRGGDVSTGSVPDGMEPRPGECRVWLKGMPAEQQPAPTSCDTAADQVIAMRSARVLVGRDSSARKGGTITCGGRSVRFPSAAPSMRWGSHIEDGQTIRQLASWHLKNITVGVTDRQKDGVPETISWRTKSGQVLQIWHDFDNDRTADMVQVFCDGQEVQQLWY